MTDLTAQTNGSAVNGAALHALNGNASAAVLADLGPAAAAIVPDASAAVEVVPAADAVTGREVIPVPPANKSATPCDVRVADIRKGQLDCRGEKIDFVFCRRRDYAIYRSGGKIIVQHSDDDAICKTQAAAIAELLPLRSQLQYLVKDMAAPSAYHWQIAEALRLGLDGQKEAAKNTIQNAIDNIIARRVSQGRDIYLMFAGAMVFTIVSLLCAAAVAMPYAWASLQ